ncbi:MAG: hypothetical protein KC431_16200 [Myxococcales bacterium]|nr:hypothetical protein [Myxococcales bacterium]MCA9699065.1 hypothetical protein [Myxococcales bacterium]
MTDANQAESHRRKQTVRWISITVVTLGLVAIGFALGPATACMPFDTCMTDDGVLLCDPICQPGGAQCEQEYTGQLLVRNWEAQPGDLTVCPFSNQVFEVEEDSSRFSYEGYSFVFSCSGVCMEEVASDPGLFLDDLVYKAGGPATDPDHLPGGNIPGEQGDGAASAFAR